MKVLLRRNVKHLGQIGEVVEVKPGYARNYLVPCGLAIEPTEANLRAIEEEKQRYLEELAKQRKEIEARAQVLNGKEVTIAARANEEGHLYGSVGAQEIVNSLKKSNITITPDQVRLEGPLKELGLYTIKIHLGQDVDADLKVWVVPAVSEEISALRASRSSCPVLGS